MSALTIDAEELIMALEDNSYEITHWLDLHTGDVIPICESSGLPFMTTPSNSLLRNGWTTRT